LKTHSLKTHSLKTRSLKTHAKTLVLYGSLLLGLAGHASAQHMNAPDAPCGHHPGTTDMMACLDRAHQKADQDLNATYARIMRFLTADERPSLIEAQRQWLRYRDASCASERQLYGGGTALGPAYLACMEAETRHRAADLRTAYGWRVDKFSR